MGGRNDKADSETVRLSQLSEIVRAPPEGGPAGSNNTDCASEIIVFFIENNNW